MLCVNDPNDVDEIVRRMLVDMPKVNGMATTTSGIDVKNLIDACKRLKKIPPSYDDLLRENKKMEDKFNKAMGLLEYLNENDLLQDEHSYTTLCELRGDKEDEN